MSAKRKTSSSTDLTNTNKSKKLKKASKETDIDNAATTSNKESESFMECIHCHILSAGIQKVRMNIFKTQLQRFGGKITDSITEQTTHLVVEEKLRDDRDRLHRVVNSDDIPDSVVVVDCRWLCSCFRLRQLVDTKEYEITLEKKTTKELDKVSDKTVDSLGILSDIPQSKPKNEFPKMGVMFTHIKPQTKTEGTSDAYRGGKLRDSGSDYSSSEDERSETKSETNDVSASGRVSGTQLPEMVHTYESTNDRWRAFGYQKAIQALKKHPTAIASWEEAKALPGVGKRLADKIWEIAESGGLRKLEEFKGSEQVKVINMFSDVWGAGPTTAQAWYQMGFRSLEDLSTKANLTKQQRIGLTHYHDFLDRMPYAEAGEIQRIVREKTETLAPGALAVACGSFRRKKETCGDVDVLITHPDGHSHQRVFADLLTGLKSDGFLTDDLVSSEVNGNQKKYMGVCRLAGEDSNFRRIDIIAVPYAEYACALLHFTGSAHFNRSIRHLAKKLHMSLSEHSLRVGVVRSDGDKVFGGTVVPTPSEESIFKFFGLEYRPPEDRDH